MLFDDSPNENIPSSVFPQSIRPFSFLHLPFPLPELSQPLTWQPADRSRPFIKPELMPSDPERLALKQTVSDWLVAGIHFDHAESRFREKRRFLEAHLELLAPESDLVLQDIMVKTADKAQMIDALRQHIRVLHQSRVYGGTIQAIQRAYVYVYGGLVLDIPETLAPIIRQHSLLTQTGQSYQTAAACITLLREGISLIEHDSTLPPEICADLYRNLMRALRVYEEPLNRSETLNEAIKAGKRALLVYTKDRYPVHYAALQHNLGHVYTARVNGRMSDNITNAVNSYKEALALYNRYEHPEHWAQANSNLGNAYATQQRSWPGSRTDALQYYTATLQVVAADTYPHLWAETQLNLGRLYLERMDGDRSPHLERAIQCFCAALRYFNREQHADFWAQSQTYLGVAYIQRLEGERASNLERALRCLQAALRVVTYEALPEQWGETHRGLGLAYLRRSQGEKRDNIESAIQHLQIAAQSIDKHFFPIKWIKLQNDLGEAYATRIKGSSKKNRERAIAYHEEALQTDAPHPHLAEEQRARQRLAWLRVFQS